MINRQLVRERIWLLLSPAGFAVLSGQCTYISSLRVRRAQGYVIGNRGLYFGHGRIHTDDLVVRVDNSLVQ